MSHTGCLSARPPAPLQGDDGKWNKFGGRLAWDKSAICANNPAFGGSGGYKNTEDYPAAPNIDHSQVGAAGGRQGGSWGAAAAAGWGWRRLPWEPLPA